MQLKKHVTIDIGVVRKLVERQIHFNLERTKKLSLQQALELLIDHGQVTSEEALLFIPSTRGPGRPRIR